MYRTAQQTADLVAVILKRSEQTRARISTKTIKVLARRTNLRSAFVVELAGALADRHGWVMAELASGGYGVVQAKSLEAARAVTGRRWLTDEERRLIQRSGADLSRFDAELCEDQDEPEEEE